jgi:hypothetical protein
VDLPAPDIAGPESVIRLSPGCDGLMSCLPSDMATPLTACPACVFSPPATRLGRACDRTSRAAWCALCKTCVDGLSLASSILPALDGRRRSVPSPWLFEDSVVGGTSDPAFAFASMGFIPACSFAKAKRFSGTGPFGLLLPISPETAFVALPLSVTTCCVNGAALSVVPALSFDMAASVPAEAQIGSLFPFTEFPWAAGRAARAIARSGCAAAERFRCTGGFDVVAPRLVIFSS